MLVGEEFLHILGFLFPTSGQSHRRKFLYVYQGDNQNRISGQSNEFKQLNIHAWEAFEMGQDIHLQAAPSQAELLYREFKVKKDTLKTQTKQDIMNKYGDAASADRPVMELLLGQSERQIEYDQAGRIIKGQVSFTVSYLQWMIGVAGS